MYIYVTMYAEENRNRNELVNDYKESNCELANDKG
jgi:hypothetical protein